MKIKSLVFAFCLCALIFISVAEIESFKDDEKHTRAFEESKIKLGVNKDGSVGGGGYGGELGKGDDDDWNFWIKRGGVGVSFESGDLKGSTNIRGVKDGGENIGLGEQVIRGNEVAWREAENNEFGGQEERRNEVTSVGKRNKGFGKEEVET